MEIDLVLTPARKIIPATEFDLERIEKYVRPNDLIPATLLRKPRNGDHHRKFMALVYFVTQNHPHWHKIDDVLRYLKYKTGHVYETVTADGELLFEPRSISFRVLDENEFSEWSEKAKAVIFDELFPDFKPEDRARVWREINEWLEWAS